MSAPSYLRYANQGATRNLPLDPRLTGALSFLGDLGVTAEVFSGGQPGKGSGGRRVGSTRHDHGNAGDFRFYKDGRQLDWGRAEDLPTFQEIVRRGKAAGITGFGAGPGYMGQGTMHVGFGAPGTWGAGGRGSNAPDWLREAYGGAPAGAAPSPLTTAVADRQGGGAPALVGNAGNDTLAPTGAPSMAGPTVNIGMPNERRTKLQEALLQRALQGGENIRHPLELVGNLAQVWAANRGLKKSEDQEASGLQAALANANLDPEFNLVAQLTGGREGVAQAILGQQEARTAAAARAEARADRQATQDYQRSQDAQDATFRERQIAIQEETARSGRVPAGYRTTESGLEAIPGGPADPTVTATENFRTLSADEAAQRGLPPGQYQVGPNDRVYPIGDGKGSSVTVVNGQSNKFREKADERMVARFGTIADGGAPAADTMQTIPVMRELLAQAPTGPIAGALAERFPGFSTAGDAFQATVNQIAPTLRIPGSGAMSDRDMDILLGSFPRLRSDPNANQIIMDVFERKAQVNHQRSQIASAALRGEIEPASADQQLAELDRVSILDDRTRALLSGNPSQSAAPAAPATGAPVDYRTKYGLE